MLVRTIQHVKILHVCATTLCYKEEKSAIKHLSWEVFIKVSKHNWMVDRVCIQMLGIFSLQLRCLLGTPRLSTLLVHGEMDYNFHKATVVAQRVRSYENKTKPFKPYNEQNSRGEGFWQSTACPWLLCIFCAACFISRTTTRTASFSKYCIRHILYDY